MIFDNSNDTRPNTGPGPSGKTGKLDRINFRAYRNLWMRGLEQIVSTHTAMKRIHLNERRSL